MLKELRQKLDSREIGACELTKEYLKKIKTDNCNSFITVCENEALKSAEIAQKRIDEGNSGALTGIAVSIKDNICTKGIKTTCASKMLEDYVPVYDADVVEKLKSENAVIIGKTNMDEFAMGGSSQTSYFGGVKNPHDPQRVTGGSSGGAAASVAAGLVPAALGSDTGGSVRQPSSFCGVVGLKPGYGRVSRYGLIAFASSLDQIGPIATTAEDTGIILNAVAGKSKHDMTSISTDKEDFTAKCGLSMRGVKIGLPKEFFAKEIDAEVAKSVTDAARELEKAGAELVECSLPSLEYAVSAYYLISSAEAASNLARFDGVKYGHRSENGDSFKELIENSRSEGFGKEVKNRILLGNYALSSGYYDAYYKNATRIRSQIKAEFKEIFSKCSAIITPTAPTTAYKIGYQEHDSVKMYMSDICTVCANISGLPSISVPCGKDSEGMPIGMSITGKMLDEAYIIGIADCYEKIVKGE